MEHDVLEQAGVSDRQDEFWSSAELSRGRERLTVTAEPLSVLWIVLQVISPQGYSNGSGAHDSTGMATFVLPLLAQFAQHLTIDKRDSPVDIDRQLDI